MQENVLTPTFYEIVTDYEKCFHEAEENRILPDAPDMEAVGAFVESINRRVVTGEIGFLSLLRDGEQHPAGIPDRIGVSYPIAEGKEDHAR